MSSPPRRPPYPTVEEYRRALPHGWSSFPEHHARSSLILRPKPRGVFDGLEGLPDRLDAIVNGPTPAPEWIPECIGVGLFLALRDARFRGPTGEHDFLAWFESLNVEVLRQRGDAGTPDEAVTAIPDIWARFHVGTIAHVASRSQRRAQVLFVHPAALFPSIWRESRRRALAALLARSGAAQPGVVGVPDPQGTRFDLTWR